MNKDSLEHLSCLMDGEIQRDTSKFLVRRLGTDKDMRNTWDRYHLIRDCLRHADGGVVHTSLSQRVSVALAAEKVDDASLAAARRSASRWARPFAGAAIAATVALMAVYAVAPVDQSPGSSPAESVAAGPVQPFTSPNMLVSGPLSRPVNLSGTADRQASTRMKSYLLRHYQVAGSSAGKGFVSFVPIVAARPVSAAQQAELAAADANPTGAAQLDEQHSTGASGKEQPRQ